MPEPLAPTASFIGAPQPRPTRLKARPWQTGPGAVFGTSSPTRPGTTYQGADWRRGRGPLPQLAEDIELMKNWASTATASRSVGPASCLRARARSTLPASPFMTASWTAARGRYRAVRHPFPLGPPLGPVQAGRLVEPRHRQLVRRLRLGRGQRPERPGQVLDDAQRALCRVRRGPPGGQPCPRDAQHLSRLALGPPPDPAPMSPAFRR